MEDILQQEEQPVTKKQEMTFDQYQPVLYQITKDPAGGREKENHKEMQDQFIARTERLLEIFHQRSHVHDGLKNLSDKEIIQKVREAPTKLKHSATTLLKKLRKYNVKLDNNGEVDYSSV